MTEMSLREQVDMMVARNLAAAARLGERVAPWTIYGEHIPYVNERTLPPQGLTVQPSALVSARLSIAGRSQRMHYRATRRHARCGVPLRSPGWDELHPDSFTFVPCVPCFRAERASSNLNK